MSTEGKRWDGIPRFAAFQPCSLSKIGVETPNRSLIPVLLGIQGKILPKLRFCGCGHGVPTLIRMEEYYGSTAIGEMGNEMASGRWYTD